LDFGLAGYKYNRGMNTEYLSCVVLGAEASEVHFLSKKAINVVSVNLNSSALTLIFHFRVLFKGRKITSFFLCSFCS